MKWQGGASCPRIIGRGCLRYYTMGVARFPEGVPIFLEKIACGYKISWAPVTQAAIQNYHQICSLSFCKFIKAKTGWRQNILQNGLSHINCGIGPKF